VYALISFIALAIPQIINTITTLSSSIYLQYLPYTGISQTYFYSLLPTVVQFILGIVVLPVTLYLMGYMYQTQKNLFDGIKDVWMEHGDYWNRIKLGFRYAIILYGLSFVLVLCIVIPVGILVGVTASIAIPSGVQTAILIITAITVVLLALALVVVMPLILGSLLFTYLSTGSIRRSYNLKNIKAVIKTGWKEIYLSALASYGISMLGGILALFTLCLLFFTVPIIKAYTELVSAHIYADMFKQLKKDIKLV
jgi:hypothetical protein